MSDTTLQPNVITWFEMPTTDLGRATGFYEQILAAELTKGFYGESMAVFPAQPNGITGALVCRKEQHPGPGGPTLFLDCTGRLEEAVERVAAAGGQVLMPITVIEGGYGRYAIVRDTEGNHISLHSR